METTNIDAVALKRVGAQVLAAQLAGMSPEQQQHFWEERTRELRDRQRAVRAAQIGTQAAHQSPTDEVLV